MKNSLLLIPFILGFTNPTIAQKSDAKSNHSHKVIADSVIQTTNYTYLLGRENNTATWLAVPTMEASVGKTYYYIGGIPMNNFSSKELKRTFDVVMFLGGVTEEPIDEIGMSKKGGHDLDKPYNRVAPKENKIETVIEPTTGSIAIKDLFANKTKYEGKQVKIKAKVTKYNEDIMNKNWAHLQDGTDFEGKFDLVVTTASKVKVGDVVIFEGTVILNKDFGYGYKFDVMLENATSK